MANMYLCLTKFLFMRKISGLIVRSFLQGLLVLSPIAVTVYVIYAVFDSVDTLIPSLPRGLGFILIVGFITTVGYLGTRLFIGRMVIDAFDYLLQHTPGIKFIYSSIKYNALVYQVFSLFL